MGTTIALGVCAVLLLQIRSAICAAPAPSTSQQQSLSSYLAAQDNLQIYSSALEMTGTAGDLDAASMQGGLTLLVPSDDAFEALVSDYNTTVDDLLNSTYILPILQYSIVSMPVLSTNLTNGTVLPTLLVPETITAQTSAQPGTVSTKSTDASQDLMLSGITNSASILSADSKVGQSYVNVIDTVLVPVIELFVVVDYDEL